jgi:hypothetical protein
MLEHLRAQVVTALAGTSTVALATHGPAGLLISVFPCAAVGLCLYVRVPRTSDHLVNLEADPEVSVATCRWQARGRARVVPRPERPDDLPLASAPKADWYELVEIRPVHVDIEHETGWGAAETIEVE